MELKQGMTARLCAVQVCLCHSSFWQWHLAVIFLGQYLNWCKWAVWTTHHTQGHFRLWINSPTLRSLDDWCTACKKKIHLKVTKLYWSPIKTAMPLPVSDRCIVIFDPHLYLRASFSPLPLPHGLRAQAASMSPTHTHTLLLHDFMLPPWQSIKESLNNSRMRFSPLLTFQ